MAYLLKILAIQLIVVTSVFHVVHSQSVGTDCNGRTFLCFDDQRFQTCSQTSSGQTQTVDTALYQCSVNKYCSNADQNICSSSTPSPVTPTQPTTTTEPSATTTAEPFTCKQSGRFPHVSECHKFYLCLWLPFGIYNVERDCLFGMVFDPTTNKCTADQTTCQLQQQPFTCTSDGQFPDPSDSTRYFLCRWNGTSYELLRKSCWFGFTFDANRGECEGFF